MQPLRIVVTSDLGRVTTFFQLSAVENPFIVVTSDLGRVTTDPKLSKKVYAIVVTSDLGRVTTSILR